MARPTRPLFCTLHGPAPARPLPCPGSVTGYTRSLHSRTQVSAWLNDQCTEIRGESSLFRILPAPGSAFQRAASQLSSEDGRWEGEEGVQQARNGRYEFSSDFKHWIGPS